MERAIDLFKEIIIAILIGLLVGWVGKMIGFLDGEDSILPIVIGMIGGTVIDRCYRRMKKPGGDILKGRK